MEFVDYKNFGKCAKFEKNGIIAMVTLDIGPRIIYYGTETLNFMKEDINRSGQKSGEFFDTTYHKGEKWFLYGGHRVWKAIEDMETYVTDNYPIEYELSECGGTFYTNPTPFGLKYGFTIKMQDDGSLDIVNSIFNYGEDREIALWALTAVEKGGNLIVPLNEKTNDLLPVQNFVVWPYTDLKDDRLTIEKDRLLLRQTADERPFKIGLFSNKKEAYYELDGRTLKISYEKTEGTFADFGCNFEAYTNAEMLEIEGLDAMKTLKKNGIVEMKQRFEVL